MTMGDSDDERPGVAKRWSFARVVRMLPWLILLWGAFGTGVGLIKVIGATGGESIDPAQKARLVAEGVSEAVNCVVGAAVLFLLYFLAAFLVTRYFRSESEGPSSRGGDG